jgi:hypothetical protein
LRRSTQARGTGARDFYLDELRFGGFSRHKLGGGISVKPLFAHALAGAAIAIFCAEAQAKEIESLGAIDIRSLSVSAEESPGNFMVVDSRMEETATAAVIGGLIGAGINSAINKQEDDRKAGPFLQTAATLDIAGLVEAAILETLEKRGFPVTEPASHALVIEVKDWGLSRVSFSEPKSSVFLKVHVTMKDGRTAVWDTYIKESGTEAAFLADISPEAFAEQITALAGNTGKRIAYEIIYR